ncbi:MAG TPA: hypothetical protein VM536_02375, partial [Chloroflexia bacterium]|nr:hypothetical protein [Chloroflexia bacterium]
MTRKMPPRFALAALFLGFLLSLNGSPGSRAAPAALGAPRFFAPTGKTLAGQFTAVYDARGGLAVFGYPIDEVHTEGGILVQNCERERLEYHPEYAGTPFEVLLGRLGADLTSGRTDGPFAPVTATSYLPAGTVYVPETRQILGGAFLDYWRAHGGLPMFGYPISAEFIENGLRQQWFERARFESHPELPAAFRVSLGLLGREMEARRAAVGGTLAVAAGPPRVRHLQLGLAQGGESHDPAFLHDVVPQIAALHVPLVRVDNIYTHYHVVSRDGGGGLQFNWGELDQVVDDIRAMGAEPFICLSYTPAVMSTDGSPMQPPAALDEWRQLVTATITHFNRDRQLGIHNWEVWNEPDQGDFWR